MVSVVIHTNQNLHNQVETAGWLREGFHAHGIRAEITPDKWKSADVHVVQGPWYCYTHWRDKSDSERVLWLNRGFYGDGRFDLSLGWLRPDGTRDFRNGGAAVGNGKLPELRPRKKSGRCAVIFADYGRDHTSQYEQARQRFERVIYRDHPAEGYSLPPLGEVWAEADTAIGHSSTVLVKAKINGLSVESSDPNHVVHHSGSRAQWLRELSWAQWNYERIKDGAFWEHLGESK